MNLPDVLRRISGAGTADDLARCRIDVDDAVKAGRLTADAGEALQSVARLVAEDIATNGPRLSKPAAPGDDDRVAGTIVEAAEVSYPDTGDQVRGVVALESGEAVKFSIRKSWSGSMRALFGAAGVADDEPAEALVGKAVEVVVGEFTGRDGQPRPVVKRWHKPAGSASTAAPVAKPAAPKAPAWEADEAARSPRRGPAAKARADFKAQPAVGDGDIPFAWLAPLITALVGVIA